MSNNLIAVLPVITHDYAHACLGSVLRPDSAAGLHPNELLIIDNTVDGSAHRYGPATYRDPDGHNLGVARSWNIGARRVLEGDYDYLVIVSAALLFGPILHTTLRQELDKHWGERVIEVTGHSWHLIALHRTLFERIGLFDENFYPAYFEQIDWCYRLKLVGWEVDFVHVWVNVLSQGSALHNHVVSIPASSLLAYYAEKWGGAKGEETWEKPWGSKPLDYWPTRSIPELAAAYELQHWW